MNTMPSGVLQWVATVAESPTTITTVPSRPARSMVRRRNGRVSVRPVRGSTTAGSWCSQPGWHSSEPRWWSTVKATVDASRAAAPNQTVDRPQ